MPTVQILAFRGTGKFDDPAHAHLPKFIKTGHVTLKFESDPVFYGFRPTEAAVQAVGGEEAMLRRLLQRHAADGSLQDDAELFRCAHRLSLQGHRTAVWALSRRLAPRVYQRVLLTARYWHRSGKVVGQYALPKREDDALDPGEYNCATFPVRFGIQIPTANAKMSVYMEAMQRAGARRWFPSICVPAEVPTRRAG